MKKIKKKTTLLKGLFVIMILIQFIGIVNAATPLVPEGGAGYTVSGSIEAGNIQYTINTDGEYYLEQNISTAANGAIIFEAPTITLDGNNYTIISNGDNAIYYNPQFTGNTLTFMIKNVILPDGGISIIGESGQNGSKGTDATDAGGTGGNGGAGIAGKTV